MGAITVSSRNTFDVSGSLINNFGRFICYGYDNIRGRFSICDGCCNTCDGYC